MATGGELIIDDSLFKSIERLDKALNALKDTSDEVGKGVVKFLKDLQGADITSFTTQLEKMAQQYDFLNKTLKGKGEGFDKVAENASVATVEVKALLDILKATDEYKRESAANKALSDSKEASEAIQRYKELSREIKNLQEIKKDASEFKGSSDAEIAKDAKQAYTEANKQLKVLLAEQKSIEKKHAEDVAQYKRDANMREFREKAQLAREAANAVEKEIERELAAREKALIKQINFEQKYSVRMDNMRELATSFEERVNKSVSDEERRENEEYLKELNRRIAEEQKYVERMRHLKEMAAKVDADALKQYEEDLKKTQEAHERTIAENAKFLQEYEARMRKLEEVRLRTADISDDALGYYNNLKSGKEVRSIQNMEKALSQLREAQKRLNLNTEEGKKRYYELGRAISDLNTQMAYLTTNSKKTIGVIGEMQKRLALLFSVDSIMRYVKTLVNVRKEFELQHTALRSMLQDRDAADKIWQQTIDLAVKSPFRVKELVTYTKQLSAYRIETSKLHDTTKMLADVSAGLGVDMNRLILAYGQVRAAEYLRGTELRQFTEAGIPMLEELAKHFTSLEGRAISTADVFERISKRMVSFGDVTAVFQKMTSEGGAFYKMQEKQSETLYGIISNLHDSFDLMMNDIGKSNEGTIKNTLEGIKKLVDAWRDVAFAIKTVAYTTIVPYTAIMTTLRVANSKFAEDLLVFANRYQTTSKMLLSTERFFVGMLQKMGAGSAVVRGFMKVLGGIATLGVAGAIAGIVIGLTALITKMTSASRAAKRLKKELDEIYNEDVTNFKKQIQGFDTLLTKLKQVDKGSREHFNIIDKLNSQYGEHIGFIVNETTSYEQLAKTVDKVNKSLTVKAKLNTFEKAFAKTIEATNKQILDAQEEIKNTIEKTYIKRNGKAFIPDEADFDNIFAKFEERVKKTGKTITQWSDLKAIFKEYNLELGTPKLWDSQDFVKYSRAILAQKEAELNIEQKINDLYNERTYSTIEAREAFTALEKERQAALAKNKKATKWEIEDIQKEFDNKKRNLEIQFGIGNKDALVKETNETIDDINNKIKDSASTLGKEYANAIYIDSAEAEKGVGKIAEDTAAAYKVQKDIIKEQEALKAAGTVHDEDILDHAKKTVDALKYKLQIMGRTDLLQKEQLKAENKALQLLNKQIAALKEAKQAYDKLRERHDVEESTKRTSDAFKTLFNEVQMGDITEGMQFSLQGLIDVLDKIPNKAGEKGKQAIEKIKAEWQGGIGLDVKINEDKKLLNRIEEMFSGYELSLELEKLNIPPDIAKRLFNVDFVSLDELKSQLQDLKPQFVGTEMEDEYLKFVQKVSEMEDKELTERMKRYTEFLKKGQTERVKIKIEELRDLAKLEEDYQNNQIGAADYSLAKKGIQDEAEKKLQSLEWNEFKESDTYIRMFEDLEYASKKSIEGIIERLKDMRENLKELSPTEIKEITNAIERLEDAAANKNPFASLVESIKPFVNYLRERKKLEEEYQESREQESLLEQRYKDAQGFASKAQVEYEAISKNKDATEEQKIAAKATAEFAKQQQLNAKANLDTQKGITSELEKQKAEGEKTQSKFMKSMGEVAGYAEQAFSALPEVAANLENVFGSMSAKTKDIVDSISAIGGGIASMAGNIASRNYIGAVVDLTKVVGEFFKIGDKRREREIQRELKAVEKLQREYDKLKDSLDKAYTTTDIKHSFDEANANLQKQIDSYDKIIAAEEGKKKTDNEKLEQYRQEQEELIKQQEELLHEQVESFGGNYDFRSVAREFVDAWLDAFNETGNGMKGLEENFKEMMHNIVAEQAAAGGVAKLLEPLMNEINSALEGDFKVDEAELANIEGKSEEALKFIDDYLQSLFGEGGIYENYRNSATETGELSGLQRGIQGITEETAQIIEAYLNAIRMTVVDNGTKMSSVISSLESISNSISNTMVGYLKTVAEQTSAINSLLEGVRTSNTQAIRVELVN